MYTYIHSFIYSTKFTTKATSPSYLYWSILFFFSFSHYTYQLLLSNSIASTLLPKQRLCTWKFPFYDMFLSLYQVSFIRWCSWSLIAYLKITLPWCVFFCSSDSICLFPTWAGVLKKLAVAAVSISFPSLLRNDSCEGHQWHLCSAAKVHHYFTPTFL